MVIKASANINICANEKYFHRALQNLIQNAIQHSKSIVKISTIETDENHCHIVIEDDGLGIPEEYREKIFQVIISVVELISEVVVYPFD